MKELPARISRSVESTKARDPLGRSLEFDGGRLHLSSAGSAGPPKLALPRSAPHCRGKGTSWRMPSERQWVHAARPRAPRERYSSCRSV